MFAEQGVDEIVLRLLDLKRRTARSDALERHGAPPAEPLGEVSIGLVGKYVEYEDSYKSLKEALLHGGLAHDAKVNITWIESEQLEMARARSQTWSSYDGILVPGGFGKRGVEGMLYAIRYARESKVPYFGICLGMQTMVIEFARNVCGLPHANSTEFDPGHAGPRDLQIARIEGRRRIGRHHAPGRLSVPAGGRSFARAAYGSREISERHRHRYEFNREYEEMLTTARPAADGRDSRRRVCGDLRVADHPWYLGCQFHPEFKSKPLEPHPLFRAFIGAALEHRRQKKLSATAADSVTKHSETHVTA